MKFTTGIIVVIVAIVIFYLRIAFLRGRKKRYEREFALKRRKVRGRSKGAALNEANVVAKTDYGKAFHSAVNFENIYGVQFHPEKSHDNGIQLLKNFANL